MGGDIKFLNPKILTLEVLPQIPLIFAGSKPCPSIATTFSCTFPPPRTLVLPLHVTVTQGISDSRTTDPLRWKECRSKEGLDTQGQWRGEEICSLAPLVYFVQKNKSCGLFFSQRLSWIMVFFPTFPVVQNEAVLGSSRP